ncbi:type II toxin-antitoxin system VapC family toxin [Rhizobium sp.]|uniref:type II toxin-antitoxin system VapC family toxin n=1 Tax=Rhizobium sp. TaxID=391 RepID=UPI002899ED77
MVTDILLDTSVLSETSKVKPDPNVLRFLELIPNPLIPAPALVEFQQGIYEVLERNPIKAVKLSNWYNQLVNSGITILYDNREVIDVLGTLNGDKRLNNLKFSRPEAKRPRCGFDLWIAAIALVYRVPIATFNVKDFVLINSCYPLPGIVDPKTDTWHAKIEAIEFPAQEAELCP